MNLLVLTEEFYPKTSGGAHTQWQFCKRAAEMGNDITVVTPRDGPVARYEEVDSVEIFRPIPSRVESMPAYSSVSILTRVLYSLLISMYLLWWLRGRSIDGVFASTNAMHWVGTVESTVYGVPLVSYVSLSASTGGGESISSISLFLEWVNFRFFMGNTVFCRTSAIADRVAAVSNSDVAVLQGFLHEERIEQIVEDIAGPVNEGALPVEIQEDKTYIALVGRLVPIKRPECAVEVLTDLPDDFELVVVGDGPEKAAVEAHIRRLGEQCRVQLTGQVDHDTALRIMAVSDSLIVTSDAESLCGVALEALSLNTPVVGTEVGILPQLDHPNLYTTTQSKLPSMLQSANLDKQTRIDERILTRFSISNFAETVLDAFASETETGSMSGEYSK